MNHPELVHDLELLPCAIRDGMLYIPHADGNWVSAAKLQPFSLAINEFASDDSEEGGAFVIPPEHLGITAFVQDGSSYMAELYTRPEHGCTMHSPANPKE